MHPRIRELYYECQDESQSTEQCYQKFAELIVQECADYFGREGDRRFEVDGNWIAKTIRQHFGVEE